MLVTQRKAGTHLAGAGSFPGASSYPARTRASACAASSREELGIDATGRRDCRRDVPRVPGRRQGGPAHVLRGRAGGRLAALRRPLDVAAFAWFGPSDLDPARFPPADESVLEKAKAPVAE